MMSIENYFQSIQNIGVKDLPADLQEKYKFTNEVTDNHTTWQYYHADQDVRAAVDQYLAELDLFLKDQSKGTSDGDLREQAEEIATSLIYRHVKEGKSASAISRGGYEISDPGSSAVVKGKQIVVDMVDGKEVHYAFALQKIYDKIGGKNSSGGQLKLRLDRPVKATGKGRPSKKNPTAKSVENISQEVRFIRRFIRLHGKNVESISILRLVKSLQRAIVQKIIKKVSPLADEMRYIQDNLVKAYNAAKGKPIDITINEKMLAKLVGLAGGEQVYPSVNIIKRFVSVQGKELNEKQYRALVAAVKRYIDNKAGAADDPYYNKVKSIRSLLKTYTVGNKMVVKKAELSGLAGILEACCCENLGKIYNTNGARIQRCNKGTYSDSDGRGTCSHNRGIRRRGRSLGKILDYGNKNLRRCNKGTYSDAEKQGACSHNRGLAGLMTAQEMADQQHDVLDFTDPWRSLIGKPEVNFSMMVHGNPHAGKTILLVKFAEYLAKNFGEVLYVSAEEHGSKTLQKKIEVLLPVKPERLWFFDNIEEPDLGQFDFVIIDSVSHLGVKIADFKRMAKEHPNTGFILVLQHTKAGEYRGGKDWEHLVQIGVEVDHGLATVFRNRYGVFGALNFWQYFGTRPEQFQEH